MRSSIYLGVMGNDHYDTWALLRQTHAIIDRIIARKCGLFGITVPAYEVLHMVKYGPKPMSAYMLSHILGREHHSVVELVNRLKQKGLITRTTIDGRSSLAITGEGDQLLARMLSSMPVIEELFQAVDTENIELLKKGLVPLRQAAVQQLGLIDMGEVKIPAVDQQRASLAGESASP